MSRLSLVIWKPFHLKTMNCVAGKGRSEIPVLCISGLCIPFHNWGGDGSGLLSFAPHYTQGWGFEKADIPSKFLQMLRLHQFMTARPAKTSCLQTACWHERWISKSLKKANLCGVLLTFFQGEGRATKTKPRKDFFLLWRETDSLRSIPS